MWEDDGTAYFGGAGLMIARPSVEVLLAASDHWRALNPAAEPMLTMAQEFSRAIKSDVRLALGVAHCPSRHVGLGVGTQLTLAVASAICRFVHRTESVSELGRLTGRGHRSAIGTRGFATGGFLIDEGKRRPDDISEVRRHEFPDNWSLLLVIPHRADLWHGDHERTVFASLGAHSSAGMEKLLNREIEQSIVVSDLLRFGAALSEYNALAGEYFRTAQGGRYSSPIVGEIVQWLQSRGAAAAGQSSWGPTVFSIWDDEEQMQFVQRQAESTWGDSVSTLLTKALNRGAAIVESDVGELSD